MKYLAAICIGSIVLIGGYGAFGAGMTKSDGPLFPVGADTLLSGNEPEFAKCKAWQAEFLATISGKPDKVVYALSAEWGHVMRSVYVSISEDGQPSRGTLICWHLPGSNRVSYIVDEVGTAADLVKKTP